MSTHPSDHEILDGYRLIRFLGRGGFGEVWLCRSEAMGDYRALKWIPASNPESLAKEYESLLHYRKAAARLRSPHLVPIEHINRDKAGLYYVMPLADGLIPQDPSNPAWQPLSLTAMIHAQAAKQAWFTSREIAALLLPILECLQILSDAGLVHRDVKPDNILLFNGLPCLGDISLLGADASVITRRGTPGYATPSWYVGGHPDMYGAAATLYTLLTGNPPDKLGRAAFLWPPQGESSLTETERAEWKRFHGIIRRAADEKISERFVDFMAMARQAGHDNIPPVKARLPRILVATLTLAGVAAATVLAGFRGKQAEVRPSATSGTSGSQPAPAASESAPELTAEEKADYQALAGMIQGYIGDGKYANALASVEMLLSTYPQSRTQPAYSIARAMALKGLGRIDEAKQELKKDVHLSPHITAMSTRKDLWVEFGDLAEAENDLTRILKKFGPNTLALFFRADIRAQRGDFPGVHSDRQAAYAAKPAELEQRRLVDTMWTPLETKYPGYGEYLKTLPPEHEAKATSGSAGSAETAHDDAWVLAVFDDITSDIAKPDIPLSEDALRARKTMTAMMRDGFGKGDYVKSLGLLDQVFYSVPALANTPVLSLFRSLLLKRLERQTESSQELVKLCHRESNPRLIDARVCLLSALDRKREAQELLTRMITAVKATDAMAGEQTLAFLRLRAWIRAEQGDFPGVLADRKAALAITPDSPSQTSLVESLWTPLETRYPAYAAYLKSLPEK